MTNISLILTVAPFVLFVILLISGKISLLKISLITLALFLLIGIFYWQIFPSFIIISLIKGVLLAFDIFIIIFGAIFFLEILKSIGVLASICHYLESFSKDYRVQVILLAWFFENFLEGTAGFGTPGAIVAPILVGIGLTPINAVIVALLGNSTAGVFGAAGTPIRVGLGSLAPSTLPLHAALINCVGFLVPVFMLWFITQNRERRRFEFFEALPFALWAGIAFVIPSLATVLLGQEFPSILGSVIGIVLIMTTIKLKIFLPKNIIDPHPSKKPDEIVPLVKTLAPYAVLILFLALGKLILGSAKLSISLGQNFSVNLFNPGFIFIIVGILVAVFWKNKKSPALASAGLTAFRRSLEPFLVIVAISTAVQVMTNSGHNAAGIPSMIEVVAMGTKNSLLPLWVPFVGAFGSFITGSVTISNIMFGNFFTLASIQAGINVSKILALGVVGAAAGNMMALADILAAESVVGLKNRERHVLAGVFVPCLIYISIVGLVGLAFFH